MSCVLLCFLASRDMISLLWARVSINFVYYKQMYDEFLTVQHWVSNQEQNTRMLLLDNKQVIQVGGWSSPPLSTSLGQHTSVISFNTARQLPLLKINHDLKELIDRYTKMSNCLETPIFRKAYTRHEGVFLETNSKEMWAYGKFQGGILGIRVQEIILPVPLKISLLGFPKVSGLRISESYVLACSDKEELYMWGFPTGTDPSQLSTINTPQPVPEPRNNSPQTIFQCNYIAYDISQNNIYAIFNRGLYSINKGFCSRNICLTTSPTQQYTVTQIPFALSTPRLKGVCCGKGHTIVWDQLGRVFGWGSTQNGRLGQLSKMSVKGYLSNPRQLEELKDEFVVDARCGIDHGIALTKTGTLFEWGHEYVTQVNSKQEFRRYSFGSRITKIDVMNHHSLCLDSKGQAYHWGQHSIKGVTVEPYPSLLQEVEEMPLIDISLSENFIVCVREEESHLKSKSESIIEKTLKRSNKDAFTKLMALGDIELCLRDENLQVQRHFLLSPKAETRSRPLTSKNRILKANKKSLFESKISLGSSWMNQNDKYSEAIRCYEMQSIHKTKVTEPPSHQQLRQSIQKIRLKYAKPNKTVYQQIVNKELRTLQLLVNVLNKEILCHVMVRVLRCQTKNTRKKESLVISRYLAGLLPVVRFQSRHNPRKNKDFCISEILQCVAIKKTKDQITKSIDLYRQKLAVIWPPLSRFKRVSKCIKDSISILLDFEMVANHKLRRSNHTASVNAFMAEVKSHLSTIRNFDFHEEKDRTESVSQQLVLGLKQKHSRVLPIKVFSKDPVVLFSTDLTKFTNESSAVRSLMEKNGRKELIQRIFSVNMRTYLVDLDQYQQEKILFMKQNREEIMLEKARLFLVGKFPKAFEVVEGGGRASLQWELSKIAMRMNMFPKRPQILINLSTHFDNPRCSELIFRQTFQKYIQLISKKPSTRDKSF